MSESLVSAVVLAGQRARTTPLGEAAGVAADVLVPVAGRASLEWVVAALDHAQGVQLRVLVGPNRSALNTVPALMDLLQNPDVSWLEPEGDPASSAISGVRNLAPPVLVTAGDHALLSAAVVERFCAEARDLGTDFVVGLVPYERVRAAFPESRRTVLKFAGQPCCGANLFLLNNAAGVRAFEFWRALQQHRKQPRRIARALGLGLLFRYVTRRLTLAAALAVLSAKAGCQLGAVMVQDPVVAVDVDSVADWQLAEKIMSGEYP